jgi:hypothetical protein
MALWPESDTTQQAQPISESEVYERPGVATQPVRFRTGTPFGPHPTTLRMVKFETQNREIGIRSLLQNLADANDSDFDGQVLHTRTQTKAVLQAKALNQNLTGKMAAKHVTLIWTKGTGMVQIQTAAEFQDASLDILIQLDRAYAVFLESGQIIPPPRGAELAAATFRKPPQCSYQPQSQEMKLNDEMFVPADPEFKEAISNIAAQSSDLLRSFPEWRAKLLGILTTEFGHSEPESESELKGKVASETRGSKR